MRKRKKTLKRTVSTNEIDNKLFVFGRIGLTKLLHPEADCPLHIGSIYLMPLSTNWEEFTKLCDKPSLLKNKTIGDLLESEPLYGPYRMRKGMFSKPFCIEYNHLLFGNEFSDTSNSDIGIYLRKDDEGYINLFTDKVNYIDIYNYDKNEIRYASLNSLPAELLPWQGKDGHIHGKLEIDYALNEPIEIEFDFATTNDVLTIIKDEYVKMQAQSCLEHSIIFLKVEILRFNPKTGDFRLFIGS